MGTFTAAAVEDGTPQPCSGVQRRPNCSRKWDSGSLTRFTQAPTEVPQVLGISPFPLRKQSLRRVQQHDKFPAKHLRLPSPPCVQGCKAVGHDMQSCSSPSSSIRPPPPPPCGKEASCPGPQVVLFVRGFNRPCRLLTDVRELGSPPLAPV